MDARDKLAELIHSWIIEEDNLHGLSLEDFADAILDLQWEEDGKQYRVAVVEDSTEVPENMYHSDERLDAHWVCEATYADMIALGYRKVVKEE